MRKVMLLLLLLIAPNLFSQNQDMQYRIVSHTVKMGETVRMLSKKYLVPPADIYRLNKFAVDGISQGMVLQIPVPVKDEPAPPETVAQTEPQSQPESQDRPLEAAHTLEHRVASGETLSGLAQRYNITVKAIKDANPKVAKRGLRADEVIRIPDEQGIIPSNDNVSADVQTAQAPVVSNEAASEASGTTIAHKVQAGETLYGLAKKYNVPVSVIQKQNADALAHGLQVGQTIKITP